MEKLSNLSELYLSNNQIKSIEGIEKLTDLTELYISNNQITSIKGIEKLINLTRVDLENNQITSIEGIEKLKNLTSLFLSKNQITSVERIEKLINLRSLYLGIDQVTSLKEIEKLKKLKFIKLSYNKKLDLSINYNNFYFLSALALRDVKIRFDSKSIMKASIVQLYLNEFEEEERRNQNLSKLFRENSFFLGQNQKITIDKPFYFDAEISTLYEEPKMIKFNPNNLREIIVIDYKKDKELRDFFKEYIIEKKIKENYSKFYNNWRKGINKSLNLNEMKNIVLSLMKTVSNTFGGQDCNKFWVEFYTTCEKQISKYLIEKKTCFLPLGEIFYKYGVCRHRSLLFKMVADYVGIPCRLWGGTTGDFRHMWNVVNIGGVSYGVNVNVGLDLAENFDYETFHKGIKSGGIGSICVNRNKYDIEWIKKNYKKNGIVKFDRTKPLFNKGIYELVDEKSKEFVVVKEVVIKKTKNSVDLVRRVERELYYLKFFNNDHVIKLIDYSVIHNQKIKTKERVGREIWEVMIEQSTWAFIFELYDGNGRNFISKWLPSLKNERVIQVRESLIFLLEVIKGIRYLHSLGIAHLDLKPENILLNWDSHNKRIEGKIVLCDFETSKETWKKKISVSMSSFRYGNVPEIVNGGIIGLEVDVWGFGILICDIFKVIEIKKYKSPMIRNVFRVLNFFKVGDSNNKENILKNIKITMLDLSKRCLNISPKKRPTPHEIIKIIVSQMKELLKHDKTFTLEEFGERFTFKNMVIDEE